MERHSRRETVPKSVAAICTGEGLEELARAQPAPQNHDPDTHPMTHGTHDMKKISPASLVARSRPLGF
jgi:hypothetical protein